MNKIKLLCSIILMLSIVAMTIGLMLYNGIILFNNPSVEIYPVKGIDVSAYQGEIDWEVLAKQDILFAYIKATEGSSYVDEYFNTNFENANKTNLKVGAYHFFSYDSSGLAQAENFINTAEKRDDSMPPVIDIEFYGDKETNLPNAEETRN